MTWHADMPIDYRNAVIEGDARDLAGRLPDSSIDLCMCDPVYSASDDYLWVAETCLRVLKNGGSLLAQTSNNRRYQIETLIRTTALTPCDLLAEVYPMATTRIWEHKTFCGWRPYVWFTKGKRTSGWVMNRWHGGGAMKAHHFWGDSENFTREYVGRLCEPGGVVWDPFTGGGTVPAVCKALGRSFVAFEIDPATAERARVRVAGASVPLPFEPVRQPDLDFAECPLETEWDPERPVRLAL